MPSLCLSSSSSTLFLFSVLDHRLSWSPDSLCLIQDEIDLEMCPSGVPPSYQRLSLCILMSCLSPFSLPSYYVSVVERSLCCSGWWHLEVAQLPSASNSSFWINCRSTMLLCFVNTISITYLSVQKSSETKYWFVILGYIKNIWFDLNTTAVSCTIWLSIVLHH